MCQVAKLLINYYTVKSCDSNIHEFLLLNFSLVTRNDETAHVDFYLRMKVKMADVAYTKRVGENHHFLLYLLKQPLN